MAGTEYQVPYEVVSVPWASPVSVWMALIDSAIQEVQSYLGIYSAVDWTQVLYQYANRVAHLYFLRQVSQIPAYLVFLYFLGDKEMEGPETIGEWKSALKVGKGILGLGDRNKLSKYMVDVFIDVSGLSNY